MFDKDDFINYFDQVSRIEKKMIENIDDLLNFIKDGSLVPMLQKIKNEEVKHVNLLEKISSIMQSGVKQKH